MNLASAAPTWIFAILCALLAAAALEDAIRLRISNLTSAGVFVLAFVAAAYVGLSGPMWQNALVFALLLTSGALIFATGQMGGGDVKLLAALGLWFNIQGGIWLLAAVFISGGVLALGFIVVRLAQGKGLKRRESKGGIPYGVAIAAGAFIMFASQSRVL